MKKTQHVSELVSRAQKGNRESLGVLSAHVRQRVFVYLYRMTLDYHLAQDLAQETVLYMIQSLPRLKTTNNSSLWAWIYRSAWGKFQHSIRPQGHQRMMQNTIVDHEALMQLTDETKGSALEQAERTELFEAIGKSLGALDARHRHVLILRCFELLSYAEIASIMGGTELKARVLFFHAKHALKRRLHNRGYGRQYFLTSLTLFGVITGMRTQSVTAAVTITSNVLKTGTMATAIGAVSTHLGLITAAVVTIGLVGGTLHVCSSGAHVPSDHTGRMVLPLQSDTRWVFPQRIIKSYDPGGNGWEALSAADGEGLIKRKSLDLQTILAGQWYNRHLIIPEDHWIEFGFGGPINNGFGFDIRFDCLDTGNIPDMFLIDGQDEILQLSSPAIELLENGMFRVSFDMAKMEVPFEPVGIRVQGRGIEGWWGAPVLSGLEAQISL